MAKNSMGLKTKNKILEAANSLFNEKGFDNVSVEEIAKISLVTKAMVYYHFESKEAIMLELVKKLIELIKEETKSIMLDFNNQEVIQTHITEMIRLWKNNKEIGLFIITKGVKDKEILSKLLDMVKTFYNQLIIKDKGNSQSNKEDKTISEQYFKLLMFQTIPMVSLAFLMDNLVSELQLPEERIAEVFREEFIDILGHSVI